MTRISIALVACFAAYASGARVSMRLTEDKEFDLKLATFGDATPLIDGCTSRGDIEQGQTLLYSYEVGDFEWNNQLVLFASGASLTLYARMDEAANRSMYTWSSSTSYGPSITVKPTDSNYHKGVMYVALYGNSRSPFTISAVSGNVDTSNVNNGLTYPGTAKAGFYYFYTMSITAFFATQSANFLVTATSGDPDLYLSFTNQRPTAANYTWYSKRVGSENLTIAAGDPNWQSGTLYIGVQAYTSAGPATWQFVATVCSEVMTFTNGVPLGGALEAYAFAYYSFLVDQNNINQSIYISSAIQSYGQVYMYASFGSTRPDMNYKSWYSTSSSSYQYITVKPSDPAYRQGYLYVSVYGNQRSDYTISLRTPPDESVTALVDGQGYSTWTTACHYTFFTYNLSPFMATQQLTFAASPTTGPVMILASYDSTRPTLDSFQWKAYNASLTIAPGALKSGTLWVSVLSGVDSSGHLTCNGVKTNLTLTPTSDDVVLQLINGLPVAGKLENYEYFYYHFYVDQFALARGMAINGAIQQYGKVYMYVSQLNTRPDSDHYTWSSTSGSSNPYINIRPSDANFGVGDLWIAIYAPVRADYTIMVQTPIDGVVQLNNGVAVQSTAVACQYQYFSYAPSSYAITQDLQIAVAGNYEPVYLFVSSASTRPTNDSYTWTSYGAPVTISQGQVKNTVYVSVLSGFWNGQPFCDGTKTNFSITVTSDSHITMLTNNTDAAGSLVANNFGYYVINVTDAFTKVVITLSSTLGTDYMYAARACSRPGPSYTTWSATSSSSTKTITIDPTDPNFGVGPLYIAVQAVSTSKFSVRVLLTPV